MHLYLCFLSVFVKVLWVDAWCQFVIANYVGQDSHFSVFCPLHSLFYIGAWAELLFMFTSRDARVLKDMATGKSKGYGFVSFYNKLVRLHCGCTDLSLFLFSLFFVVFFCIVLAYISSEIIQQFTSVFATCAIILVKRGDRCICSWAELKSSDAF